MSGDNDTMVIEVKNAVNELREKVDKVGVTSSEVKEMSEKMEKLFKEEEKKHAEFQGKLDKSEKERLEQEEKAKELETRVKEFEAKMAEFQSQKVIGQDGYKGTPEYKALQQYVKYGENELSDEEYSSLKAHNKTMRMDSDTQGGYLTTTEFDRSIIKKITEISPVRTVARVRSVSKKTLEIPKRLTLPVATYEGEAAAGPDDNSTYGAESLTTYRLTVTIPYTMDLLGDSEFDLDAEVNADVSESMGQTEGTKFVLGTDSKEPEGFLVHPDVISEARESLNSLTISGDDLILLTGDLKVGYRPRYAFNRQTLAFLRTLKGTNGQYLWQAGLAPNVPNTLNGEPYTVMQDMPVYNAANNLAVIYADFFRGYTIIDRTGMIIIRDQYAKKRQAIIEVTFHRWNHGQVTLSEAFKALKIKA